MFIKKKKISHKSKITLVDTFITTNSDLNTGFYPSLKQKRKMKFLFVPTIFQSFNLLKLVQNIKKQSNENYIFKEHYLSFNNLLFAFSFIKEKKFVSNKYYFKNFNLSKIVNEEILSYQNYNSIVVGILNYKFFENISSSNIKVHKSVNWFENQEIDRGWNLGFRTFFKSFERIHLGIKILQDIITLLVFPHQNLSLCQKLHLIKSLRYLNILKV